MNPKRQLAAGYVFFLGELQRVVDLARHRVTKHGMSEALGATVPIAVGL